MFRSEWILLAKVIRLGMLLILVIVITGIGLAQEDEKLDILLSMQVQGIHPDDLTLIESNIDQLTIEQLQEIQNFLVDPLQISHSHWFNVSDYTNWNEYNFTQPTEARIPGNLARRDLFLDPARQLNARVLTNMSDEAIAALSFTQVYVEEKWDNQPPWVGEPNNAIFNWIHQDLLDAPLLIQFLFGDYYYQERVRYWYATYMPLILRVLKVFGIGHGTDTQATIQFMQSPNANAPRLAGYSYPIGNQLYLQTAETVYWYSDYLKVAEQRYGTIPEISLDTRFQFPQAILELETTDISDLSSLLFHATFSQQLREELSHPETASFWNTMRFIHAGARQREGGGSTENSQPPLFALRYKVRSSKPVGRDTQDISAFALMTTVYSDSILLDFTNWDALNQQLIHEPVDDSRSDGIKRHLSERNKAIYVIEHLGNETIFPNATHISGSRGLGLSLTPQYEDESGDFLPYTAEEVFYLVQALTIEANKYGIASSVQTLCDSPLLKMGYEYYANETPNSVSWAELTGELCT